MRGLHRLLPDVVLDALSSITLAERSPSVSSSDTEDEEDQPDGGAQRVAEEDLEVAVVPREHPQFRVLTLCERCNRGVRLVVVGPTGDVRILQQLLLGSLGIVCADCASQEGHNGHGQ
uniref:Protein E7 n=1 Tax=Equus caballus papillomavirus 2 TaxID=526413 RepID=A0A1S5SGP2_9PAPI|nr:E7 protein variant I [Equus caballus papillomavirus 2]